MKTKRRKINDNYKIFYIALCIIIVSISACTLKNDSLKNTDNVHLLYHDIMFKDGHLETIPYKHDSFYIQLSDTMNIQLLKTKFLNKIRMDTAISINNQTYFRGYSNDTFGYYYYLSAYRGNIIKFIVRKKESKYGLYEVDTISVNKIVRRFTDVNSIRLYSDPNKLVKEVDSIKINNSLLPFFNVYKISFVNDSAFIIEEYFDPINTNQSWESYPYSMRWSSGLSIYYLSFNINFHNPAFLISPWVAR